MPVAAWLFLLPLPWIWKGFCVYLPVQCLGVTPDLIRYFKPPLLIQIVQNFGPPCRNVQLVLSGLAAETYCATLLEQFPHLQGRFFAAGFTDLELALAYSHASAVVLPIRIEGFGPPAIEALATGPPCWWPISGA